MQTIGKNTVVLMKHNITGERFAKINGRQIVPLSICALAAGKDAWMRNITAKCCDCGTRLPVTDLNDGGYCEDCATAGIED